MTGIEDLYADADRVTLTDEDGTITWVLLAEESIDGVAYALVADESELTGPQEDMSVAVFCTSGRGLERRLWQVPDEAVEDRVYAHFSELMGLEGA